MKDAQSRAHTLRDRHARLETDIRAEEARPLPDSLLIRKLKRQKLLVKQQLDALGLKSGKRKTVRLASEGVRPSADIIEFPATPGGGSRSVAVEQRMVAIAR
jgi:hypothetical protein